MKKLKGLQALLHSPFFKETVELFYLILFVLAMKILGIKCLFRIITNIPCPTCGMTRAMFALLHGELDKYYRYNVMCIPVASAIIFLIVTIQHKKNTKRAV